MVSAHLCDIRGGPGLPLVIIMDLGLHGLGYLAKFGLRGLMAWAIAVASFRRH